MKNFYAAIVVLLIFTNTKLSLANCPTNVAPANPLASGVCNKGYSLFTANINDITNTLVWIDSANRVVGVGNNFQKYIDKSGLNFKVAEVGYDALTAKVGPTTTQFSSTYPSQNYTNGQYFTCASTVRIDSILLKTNNSVAGNIQIWSKAPENGGYVLQKIPFNITSSGQKNTRVPIGAILSAGSYFMNIEITSGTGILYRAIDGAVYPYTINNLISITGTNFIGDPDRYYYFFDWDVSKMCMSPMSANFSPVVTQTKNNVLPYEEYFYTGIRCDWENTAPSTNAKWLTGESSTFATNNFPIPYVPGLYTIISDDISCHCDKSSVIIKSPWFDLRDYSKETTIELEISYLYKQKNNSKVFVHIRNASNTISKTDSLNNQMPFIGSYKINLRDFILSDSVQISFEHRDNGNDSSAIAIFGFSLLENCKSFTKVYLNAKLDEYASEISWEIRDNQTNELIVNSIPFADNTPYDTILSKVEKEFCLVYGKPYKFKIKDSFGDGLDDGTHIGNYKLTNACGMVLLQGTGKFPYGGVVLPEMAWDSVVFTAGAGPKIDIGPDVVLNFDDTLIIDAGPNWRNYLWSTGDVTQKLTLIGKNYLPGKYTISIEAQSLNFLCAARDTMKLEILGNYNPTLNIGVITDKKGTDIRWELRDKDTDTLLMARGPFSDVIPYNINLATHIDTITVQHSQLLSFKIFDLSGNGLNDGTIQGRAWIGNNCTPEIFVSDSTVFPYSGAFNKYDSLVFISSVRPKFNLGNDIELCDGDSVLLHANSSANEFHWSTGESTPSIWVKADNLSIGENTITVFNNQGVCHDADTIKITKRVNVSASFTTTLNGGKLTATGTGAAIGNQTYLWDFGDGATANTRNAVHQYSANGNYVITYTITAQNGCVSKSTKNINVTGVGINNTKAIELTITPNPSSGIFKIDASEIISSIDVYDIQGRKLRSIMNDKKSKNFSIDLYDLEVGFYFLKIKLNKTEIVKYISIKR